VIVICSRYAAAIVAVFELAPSTAAITCAGSPRFSRPEKSGGIPSTTRASPRSSNRSLSVAAAQGALMRK